MNLLFTSGGRRVSLVQMFRTALGGEGRVLVGDADPTAPALYVADQGLILPRVQEPHYADTILELAERYRLRAIVPLIDPELPVLAGLADQFAALGCQVLTPPLPMVQICHDKWQTAQFLAQRGVPHVPTYRPIDFTQPRDATPLIDSTHLLNSTSLINSTSPSDAALPEGIRFPVVVKPRRGSAGLWVTICQNKADLLQACQRCPDPVIQPRVQGSEVTVDALGDLDGRILHLVQRQRIKIRAGEVERGVTIRDPAVERLALQVASALRPVGCINLQCFLTDDGPLFSEVNARFGGGYPLAQAAGADFPGMLVRLLRGEAVPPAFGRYETDLLMLRYDAEVIRHRHQLVGGT